MSAALYAVMFCLAFTAVVMLVPVVRLLAVRIGALDRPDGKRKIHTRTIPRLGGLAIALGMFLAGCAYLWMNPSVGEMIFATPAKMAGFIAGFVIILGLGIYDDIKGVRPSVKLFYQSIAVLICWTVGFRLEIPLLSGTAETIVSLPVTWFWLVACINAMNLVDGMDGLASGVAFFVGLVIFIMSAVNSHFAVALLSAALLGSVVGFLMYNFHPAVIFLGDSGSLLLGYLIAILAMAGSLKSHATVALLIPVLALGLPIMDTLLAILRRISRRLPISQADKEHIHHRLLAKGFTHREAVIVLYSGCLTLAAAAIIIASSGSLAAGVVLALLGVGAVAVVRLIGAHEIAAFARGMGMRLRARLDRREDARPMDDDAASDHAATAKHDDFPEALAAAVSTRVVARRGFLTNVVGGFISERRSWRGIIALAPGRKRFLGRARRASGPP